MRTILASMVAVLAAVHLFGSAAAQQCTPKLGHPPLIRAGVISAAINPTVAPIQYINDSGNIVGLDPDFGNLVGQRLCLKVEFLRTQFATMIPGLKDGRFDMVDSFMFYTPERAAQVMMIPYGATTLTIVVGKDNKDQIAGLDYFSGKKFAVELGTVDAKDAKQASDVLAKAGKAPIDVHTFTTYADVLQALAAGQVDGAFINTDQAFYYRKQGRNLFRIAVTGLDPHREALAFANAELAQAVAQTLNAIKADGSFDKLFASYHHCALPGPFKVETGPLPPPKCNITPE